MPVFNNYDQYETDYASSLSETDDYTEIVATEGEPINFMQYFSKS